MFVKLTTINILDRSRNSLLDEVLVVTIYAFNVLKKCTNIYSFYKIVIKFIT